MSKNPFEDVARALNPGTPNPFRPAGIGSKHASGMGGIFGRPAGGLDPFGQIARRSRTWSEQEKIDVWIKGTVHPMLSPEDWRWDQSGRLIYWYDYGKSDSQHGWEIDHIVPVSRGGSDLLSNLRPLHCGVNRSLGGFLGAQTRGLFPR